MRVHVQVEITFTERAHLDTVLTRNGWQMAKFFKHIAGTPQETLLGIDCIQAPTRCRCF